MTQALARQTSASTEFLDLGVLDCELDQGIAHRAAIGLLVLSTDQTMEHEFRQVVRGDGVAFYATRVLNDVMVTNETLRAMRDKIAPATELILPGLPLDVVGFGCTSASMVLGEEVIFEEIRKARPGIACTTPITAAFAAFKTFGADRIGVLTPYSAEVNETVRAYLESKGVNVAAFATFDKVDDREAARISPRSIAEGIKILSRRAKLDAVFVSCTSLRLCEEVAGIEAEIGIPVTSSDHALAWHCMRLAGVNDVVPNAGMLFERGV
ncbi:maleate cis-trans isomerase family protein [Rhodoligotrophos defluvii]|uniref:maleate cis-trans isomerase family protein n=1 Tax=Rhodoligotrophos defluvii TaxID=2561934 RepID=UPI0010C9D0EF|nr:Asp/Glu racemase [Rhodoligotrophos defluvii]